MRSHRKTRRVDQQKPKTQIKMKTTKNYEVNFCKVCRNGYKISKRIWWIRMLNHINTLPALLVNDQWSREQKWYQVRVSTVSILTSRKHRNCDICFRTKITRASCRRRTGTVVPKAEHFSDVITADHKVFSEGCESRHNHRYAVVVKDLATQETQKSLQMFLEPTRKPKVIHTDSS